MDRGKKSQSDRKSGYAWGLLVHGNRAIAASVFKNVGQTILEQPISEMNSNYVTLVVEACEAVYPAMLSHLEAEYPNKALAVLFKGSSNCKAIHEAVAERVA